VGNGRGEAVETSSKLDLKQRGTELNRVGKRCVRLSFARVRVRMTRLKGKTGEEYKLHGRLQSAGRGK